MVSTCYCLRFIGVSEFRMGKVKAVKSKRYQSQDDKPKKQKHTRWKKGHSCASNPETTKFRQAAKDRLFNVNVGTETLRFDQYAVTVSLLLM